jgi:hypothetical protein
VEARSRPVGEERGAVDGAGGLFAVFALPIQDARVALAAFGVERGRETAVLKGMSVQDLGSDLLWLLPCRSRLAQKPENP